MTKNKFTKRALMSSVLSLGLSCAMLIGTTFAWFTDTDSVNVNTIVAGNLDVELVDSEGKELNETLQFADAEGNSESIKWEPGATYELPAVYVKNNGDIDLKYQISINGIEGDDKLLEAIEWTVKLGDSEVTTLDNLQGELEAGKMTEALTISGHMKENSGNEYKGKTIEGVSINVVATQNNENAAIPVVVKDNEELSEALENAGDKAMILLSGEFSLPSNFSNMVSNKSITFDGGENGATIDLGASTYTASGTDLTFKNITIEKTNDNYKGFYHSNSETYINCTLNGTYWTYAKNAVFENCTFNQTGSAYNIWTYGSEKVNFKNCVFNSNGKSVLIYNEGAVNSNVNFDSCEFIANQKGYTSTGEHCAAIEIDSSSSTFEVNINNSTANDKFNGIVRHKKGTQATIYVDGVKKN